MGLNSKWLKQKEPTLQGWYQGIGRSGGNWFRWYRRIGVWLAIALLIYALFRFTPMMALFDQALLKMKLHSFGGFATLAFVLLHIAATVMGIPGTMLTVAGGAIFGLIWGTVWSVIGATIGAIGAFWLARNFLHSWAERHFGHHPAMAQFKQSIRRQSLSFVLVVRFAPISPFNVVNFLFGLTPIGLKHYTLGTFLGIIPGTLAYTWLGAAGSDALQGGDRLPVFLALGLLAALCFLPMLKRRQRRDRTEEGDRD
ncbi:TVP38/TMEM64 family protein [Leptothermofonsia sp. ETS-13]|uniref:TVP38/TMEM64 family protein n=1 Tax=Leptothermofonsia sp. ETS-13 TaxID=3035696 RepID=UPI003B9F4182